ncbi:hypothetical protein BA1_14073 [Bacillus xiamenensis]|nr:hypothetical protein BA1_14073 [Bacillus xiamenensis]
MDCIWERFETVLLTSQELIGKTLKNIKVEVMKDRKVIALGTFNDAKHDRFKQRRYMQPLRVKECRRVVSRLRLKSRVFQ